MSPSFAGKTFDSYQVKSLIGVGGMGEVYLARDLNLKRDVAIKVLPGVFLEDADRVSRFTREAEVLASLNHPHIAAIYDMAQFGDSRVLILELVEGESLADRISHGPIGRNEVLRIAKQIASALEAAHEKGIIHRDLKPANIKLTLDGNVKLLDFGLAKMAPAAAADMSGLPTKLTVDGTIAGTPAYMSPEQAKGHDVDRTTDVWAFGCVLYEMLAGQATFRGRTTGEILSEVFKAQPDWSLIPGETPEGIQRLLRRCLQEDPRRRLRDIGDARIEIEEIERAPGVTAASSAIQSRSFVKKTGYRRRSLLAGAVVASMLGVGIFWMIHRGSASRDEDFSLRDAEVVQLTSIGNAALPAVSPDGRYVVYVQRDGDRESLWIRQTDTPSNVQIVPPKPNVRIAGATVTPDGNFVDFITGEQTERFVFTLWRVPFLGSTTPQRLIDDVHSPITWSPDGRRFAFLRSDATLNRTDLVIADADGRNERVLVTRREPDPRFFTLLVPSNTAESDRPTWSPDGKVIAAPGVATEGGVLHGYTLFVNVADASVRAVVQTPPGNGVWIDKSSLLWSRPTTIGGPAQLWKVSADTGNSSRLTNDLINYSIVSLTSDRDRLVAARTEQAAALWIGDPAGNEGRDVIPAIAPPGIAGANISWADDGLLFASRAGNGSTSLAFYSPDQGTIKEVVAEAAFPAVTSDGRTIVYGPPQTFAKLYKADADGRHVESLNASPRWLAGVTRDNRSVIYTDNGAIWIAALDGARQEKILDIEARTPDLSPDGKSLAFVTIDKNQTVVVTCELPSCGSQKRLIPPGLTVAGPQGGGIRWTPDSRGIAFVKPVPQPNIWIQPLDGGPARQLTKFTDGRVIPDFAWSRDGKRLAAVRLRSTTDIVLFKGLRRAKSPTP